MLFLPLSSVLVVPCKMYVLRLLMPVLIE